MKKVTSNTPLLLVLIGLALIIVPIIIALLVGLFSSSETVGANIGAGVFLSLLLCSLSLVLFGVAYHKKALKESSFSSYLAWLDGGLLIGTFRKTEETKSFARKGIEIKNKSPTSIQFA